MIKNKNKKLGFSLVELLVVIGVIALLISILLPAINRARQQANQVICSQSMSQFGVGLQIYCDQNRGVIPQKGPDGSNSGSNLFGPSGGVLGVDDSSIWFNAIPKVLNRKSYYEMLVDDQKGNPLPTTYSRSSIFICPAANPVGSSGYDTLTLDQQYFLLYGIDSQGVLNPITVPGPGPFFKFNSSYVYNSKFVDSFNPTLDGSVRNDLTNLKLNKLRPSCYVVTMVEKLSTPGEYKDIGVQRYNSYYPSVYNGKISPIGLLNNVGQPKSNWKRFTTRHKGGGNILFADSHVEWFSWPDVQIQKDQMPYSSIKSDANQYNKIIWSIAGPIN